MKVIDSFAWFEYFFGTSRGKVVDRLLQNGEDLATPSVVLTEIIRKFSREDKKYDREIAFVAAKSSILPITKEVAIRAGTIKELHFSDALILATAQQESAILITGDKDFKGIKGVQLI